MGNDLNYRVPERSIRETKPSSPHNSGSQFIFHSNCENDIHSEGVSKKYKYSKLERPDKNSLEAETVSINPPKTFYRGVSLEFLKHILRRGNIYGRANGIKLKKLLILRETNIRRCSLAELYKDQIDHYSKLPVVGKVKFFVSHSWAYKFSTLVEAIERFEQGNPDRTGAYYFIDYFAVNQWKPNKDLNSLANLIQRLEAVVLVLSPLDKPIPMTRCWCLWELFISIKRNVPIHVALPDDQHSLLKFLLVRSSKPWQQTQFQVKSNSSKASEKCDEYMIKTAIKQSEGFSWLNKEVQETVFKCVQSLALSEIDHSQAQPFREYNKSQTQNMLHHTRSVLKIPQHLITKGSTHSLAFMDEPGIKGNLTQYNDNLTSRAIILKTEQLMENEQNVSFFFEEEESDIERKFSDDDSSSSLFVYYWTQCWWPYTSHKSLAHLLTECFVFLHGGEVLNISSMILEYIGGCTCPLRKGVFMSSSFICHHCRSRCTCNSPYSSGCDICRLREVNRCFRCYQRYVQEHQCYPRQNRRTVLQRRNAVFDVKFSASLLDILGESG